MPKTYQQPTNIDLANVISLLPDHNQGELTPKTPVICVNRGPRTLTDMHDGHQLTVPPHATFQATYEQAVHLQRRQIVPGTKSPDSPDQYVSWIGILNIDSPDRCEPFDDEFLARYNEAKEALNRDEMSPADRDVQVVSTRVLRPRLGGLGEAPSGGGGLKPMQRLEGGSDEAREAVLAPVEGSDAAQAAAAALAAGWTPPEEGTLRVHSAPPPVGARRTRK